MRSTAHEKRYAIMKKIGYKFHDNKSILSKITL